MCEIKQKIGLGYQYQDPLKYHSQLIARFKHFPSLSQAFSDRDEKIIHAKIEHEIGVVAEVCVRLLLRVTNKWNGIMWYFYCFLSPFLYCIDGLRSSM